MEFGAGVLDMRERSETKSDFKSRLRRDGVHLEHEHLRSILKRLLNYLGEPSDLEPRDSRWDMRDFFPGQCWKCGGKHKKGEGCQQFDRWAMW